ncbi:MAG TPA: HYR domain-containing protein, partial [Chryseolinea sp.]
MDFVEKVGWQGWRLYLLLLFTSITVTATGQNCDVDFPGTALRSFSTTCGGVSSANLTLGKTVNMGDGDVFTFDRPVINIFGNLHVDARGNGKIVVPVGVTVNVWNNFKLDAKNSGCSAANPCTFEIEVNGTLNLFDDFDNSLVTIVWTGTGNVIVGDNFKNSSNGCMACGTGGCPGFDVDPGKCDDDGSGCPVSDFCALIDDRCSTDVTDPVITACPDRVVNLAGPGCTQIVTWPPPDATDNCVISSLVPNYPSGTAFPKGITTVQYTATDGAGNTATCSFIVNVVDTRPPEITSCPANITVIANASCQAMATWEPPSLGNNCSGATLNSDRTPGSIFQLGRTRVTYTATSPNGQSSCSFDVTVVDDSAPVVFSCEDVIVNAGPDCRANVSWTLPSTSDCNEVQLSST